MLVGTTGNLDFNLISSLRLFPDMVDGVIGGTGLECERRRDPRSSLYQT